MRTILQNACFFLLSILISFPAAADGAKTSDPSLPLSEVLKVPAKTYQSSVDFVYNVLINILFANNEVFLEVLSVPSEKDQFRGQFFARFDEMAIAITNLRDFLTLAALASPSEDQKSKLNALVESIPALIKRSEANFATAKEGSPREEIEKVLELNRMKCWELKSNLDKLNKITEEIAAGTFLTRL